MADRYDNESEWIKKRQHPRISWSFMIRYRLRDQVSAVWNVSTVKNISLGGCCFFSDTAYKPGDILDIEVQFPMIMEAMKFIGEVKRCDERIEHKSSYGIGIQFKDMDATKQNQFLDTLGFFMNRQLRDKG